VTRRPFHQALKTRSTAWEQLPDHIVASRADRDWGYPDVVVVPREAGAVSTPAAYEPLPAPRPRLSVEELLAAKGTPAISSLDDLAADTFSSDEELDEFLAFTRAERSRDLS
jgi:hypothetical protein